jgi:hypothetical protein
MLPFAGAMHLLAEKLTICVVGRDADLVVFDAEAVFFVAEAVCFTEVLLAAVFAEDRFAPLPGV